MTTGHLYELTRTRANLETVYRSMLDVAARWPIGDSAGRQEAHEVANKVGQALTAMQKLDRQVAPSQQRG